MTQIPPGVQSAHAFISKRLKLSGILIIAGLLVEGVSLLWNHPLSFVVFLGFGGLLLATGIVLYLWALVSRVP
ncbi:MAG TPA: hypothetical protein VG759_29630 [Candidatus Angelobacter sp.]|nr:hypothetical protein [Candidatus Angelobacter sp.]